MLKISALWVALYMPCLTQQTLANSLEIQHLLQFIEHSHCIYQRNNHDYTGQEAVAHIQKKYDYFKDDIQTTEDFIELSATKSTMSGKFYNVQCPNKKAMTSKQWLLDELASFRQTQS